MTAKILNSDLVRMEIARFWNAFTEKKSDELAGFYASECSVFGSSSKRAEPGRLAAARRHREYFGKVSVLRVKVGNIDVVMLGETAAIATYTFEFHAAKTSRHGNSDEHIVNGRCSHIFGIDADDQVKIFHEHMSLPID